MPYRPAPDVGNDLGLYEFRLHLEDSFMRYVPVLIRKVGDIDRLKIAGKLRDNQQRAAYAVMGFD